MKPKHEDAKAKQLVEWMERHAKEHTCPMERPIIVINDLDVDGSYGVPSCNASVVVGEFKMTALGKRLLFWAWLSDLPRCLYRFFFGDAR